MTMKVTIKNEDQTRTLDVFEFDGPAEGGTRVTAGEKRIGPGETAEFWIHSTRTLDVREGEASKASAPAPGG